MSKCRINRFLPIAYDAVKKSELIKDDKLQGNYKAQIASFGAAISMGSLLSAIAFFSEKGSSDIIRQELMKLIYYIIRKDEGIEDKYDEIKKYALFEYVKDNGNVKQKVLDAAIAIKLTLNLFEEEKSKEKNLEKKYLRKKLLKIKEMLKMSISNMNYFFNKTYYDFLKNIDNKYITKSNSKEKISEKIEVGNKTIADIINKNNNDIINHRYQKDTFIQPLQDILSSFEMKVEYPGLLIGIGNSHQANIKGEIALGFNFDYVTGLPYIPGSSLKGKLASAFDYYGYILDKLNIKDIDDNKKEEFVKKIKTAIFGDDNISGKDIFIDSFVSDYNNKKILKLDHLAPHHQDEKLLTLGEVNVITMLRLAPGTKIKFNFILNDSIIEIDGKKTSSITKDKKIKLFKEIIKDFGIGAKTNVGYGYLV